MFKKILLTAGLFFMVPLVASAGLPGARSATNSAGDVFLGGNYIEVGISKGGSFGTNQAPPSSFNAHRSGSLGLIADGDGWNVGNPPTDGDFFLPGTEEERYILSYKIGDTIYEHIHADRMGEGWNNAIQIVSVTDESDLSNNILKAVVTGITKENVKMEIIYSFHVDDKYYNTEVKITNLGDQTISDVRFTRSFDPDQDADLNGVYDTYNKVTSNPDSTKSGGEDNYAMVVARGGETLDGFFFVSFDNRARASVCPDSDVCFSPNSGYLEYMWVETTPGLPTYSDTESLAINPKGSPQNLNGYKLDDTSIAISTKLGDLAKDEVGETNYYSSLDPDVIASIGAILKAVAAKVKNLSDTRIEVETKEGYEYSIDNGAHWQDSGVFEGLEPGKTYTVLSRIKAVGETPASEPEETSVTTKNSAKESPNTFELIVTEDEITIENVPGYEYSIDNGTTWQKSPVFKNLEPDTVYTIIARYEETYTEMPGYPTDPIVIRTPAKIETALDTATNVSVEIVVEEESPGITIHKGLLYEAIMNDEDVKEIIEEGHNAKIVFDVEAIELDEEELEKIKENASGDLIAFSVNATIKLYSDSAFVKAITTSDKKITFTVRVPKEYVKKGRNFTIVRKHIDEDGTVIYESFKDEDNDDKTITISSDKFSEFTIVYNDNFKNPKTSDRVLDYILLFGLSIACIYFYSKRVES